MQLALVMFFLPFTDADTVLAPGQLVLVVLFLPPTGTDTVVALGQLALCGIIYLYAGRSMLTPCSIHIYLQLHGS